MRCAGRTPNAAFFRVWHVISHWLERCVPCSSMAPMASTTARSLRLASEDNYATFFVLFSINERHQQDLIGDIAALGGILTADDLRSYYAIVSDVSFVLSFVLFVCLALERTTKSQTKQAQKSTFRNSTVREHSAEVVQHTFRFVSIRFDSQRCLARICLRLAVHCSP